MNKFINVSCILLILTISLRFGFAESKPGSKFDKLKSLAGEWEGKSKDGKPVILSYKLVSGDSALVETLQPRRVHRRVRRLGLGFPSLFH